MSEVPYTRRIHVRKDGSKYTDRELLREAFDAAPDGWLEVTVTEDKRAYNPTRYKFYFGHVVETILLTVGKMFRVMLENGTWRTVNSPEEMHEVLKRMYNPVTYVAPNGQQWTQGASTTEINDREFVQTYIESIMADFSQPPYNCEFLTRDEWKEQMKAAHESTVSS